MVSNRLYIQYVGKVDINFCINGDRLLKVIDASILGCGLAVTICLTALSGLVLMDSKNQGC